MKRASRSKSPLVQKLPSFPRSENYLIKLADRSVGHFTSTVALDDNDDEREGESAKKTIVGGDAPDLAVVSTVEEHPPPNIRETGVQVAGSH